jgi:hypothetical protein
MAASPSAVSPNRPFFFEGAKRTREKVCDQQQREAARIDTNGDGFCSDAEIEAYMRSKQMIKPAPAQSNVPRLVQEFKHHLAGRSKSAIGDAGDYKSFDQLNLAMAKLVCDHPDKAQLVSIGKSTEGRDIWALKISSNAAGDTSNKPGVVFTGTHHAREWMTPEVMLGLATDMLENYDSNPDMKRRVDGAETWVLPVVNPDGFVYSQTSDNMWRKTRSPITATACPADGGGEPAAPIAYGVDPNRNYWDGKPEHLDMYRPAGDTPCSTDDDYGASDDPNDESYRGAAPASEPEVQALMAFEYGRPNIHGIIDHHSYGDLLMRPWDQKPDAPPDVKDYDEVAARMLAAQGDDQYQYIQTFQLYPTTGASVSCHEANGRYGFGIEMGQSFQPDYSEYASTYKKCAVADFAFLDWIIEKYAVTPASPVGDRV